MRQFQFLFRFLLVAIALAVASCSAPPQQDTITASPTAVEASNPAAPTETASAPDPTASATPTIEPTSTPTIEPSITPTITPSPTPTVLPTPTMLGACAEIWQPGYYKIWRDIKNTSGRDCFYVQTRDAIIDCDNHVIEGGVKDKEGKYVGYGFYVRAYGFPFLQPPTNIEIRNCKVIHHRTGIVVEGGVNVFLHHNDLSNNHDDTDDRRFGAFLGQSADGGIRLTKVQGARIENNITNNQAIGIDARDSTQIIVANNKAENNSAWGINFINTSDSEISGNIVRDNIRFCKWGSGVVARGCDAGGITLQDGSSRNVVKNNIASGDNGNGIFIKAHFARCGDDNLIQGNKIVNAVYNGIELGFCRGNKIIGNEISGSVDGILFGFDTGTEIRGNLIKDMRNHGLSSWNSRATIVEGNQIYNSREAILFYWDIWDQRQFSFLTPSPDRYASRDHIISRNFLQGNSVAAVHMKNSSHNRIESNVFAYNGRDIWLEGVIEGTVIITPTPLPTATPTNTLTPTPTFTPTATPTLTSSPTATRPTR